MICSRGLTGARSKRISEGTYNQTGSLTALMDHPPTAAAPSASDAAAYQKLMTDIQSGADKVTILADAAQLAIAAAANGDTRLEGIARNIGNSIGNGSYGAGGSLAALKDAAPGAQGSPGPQGPVAQPTDTGKAYPR